MTVTKPTSSRKSATSNGELWSGEQDFWKISSNELKFPTSSSNGSGNGRYSLRSSSKPSSDPEELTFPTSNDSIAGKTTARYFLRSGGGSSKPELTFPTGNDSAGKTTTTNNNNELTFQTGRYSLRSSSRRSRAFATSDMLLDLIQASSVGEMKDSSTQQPAAHGFSTTTDVQSANDNTLKSEWEKLQCAKTLQTFSCSSFNSFPTAGTPLNNTNVFATANNSIPAAATTTTTTTAAAATTTTTDPTKPSGGATMDWNKMFLDLMKAPAAAEAVKKQEEEKEENKEEKEENKEKPPVVPEAEEAKVEEEKPNNSNNKKTPYKPRKKKPRQTQEVVVDPRDNDVLLGRGGRSNHHPGNKIYRQLVEDTKIRYKQCNKTEKTAVSQHVVDVIQKEHGGRFLELMPNGNGAWCVVTNVVARKKVSQALRENSSPQFRKEKREKYSKK